MATASIEHLIKDDIRAGGPITFARFMEKALYHVPGGYYTSGVDRVGREGDFYTSPLAHPAFGALIAVQLEQMWGAMDRPTIFHVVELGSGKGALARDIGAYGRHLSAGFAQALRYVTVERGRAESQQGWDCLVAAQLPLRGIQGCILSNELLDAMPFHRIARRRGELREIYVGLQDGELVEVVDEPSTPRLQQRLTGLGIELEEGQEAEINLLLEDWVIDVSRAIERGYVLTIDYGYPARQLYSRSRAGGTLMCNYKHATNRRPLARVGRQDITAHVDFTSLMAIGEGHGLRACGLVPQARFLENLGIRWFIDGLRDLGLPPAVYHANQMGMRNLIEPEGLGRFGVAVQARGPVPDKLQSLASGEAARRGALAAREGLPVPLLGPHHIDLLAGRYPHLAWSPSEHS